MRFDIECTVMRTIYMYLIVVLCCCTSLFCSCTTPKDEAVARLKNLYEDAQINSKSYDIHQWDVYLCEYQNTVALVSQFNYSSNEQQELDRIKGRCAAYAREAMVFKSSRELGYALQQARGVFKGFSEGIN